MTAVSAVDTSSTTSYHDPGAISEGFVYRDQSKRYPWWVKSVDRITVETNASEIQKPTINMIMMSLMRRGQNPDQPRQRDGLVNKISNGTPGFSLPDVSLEFASQTFFQSGVNVDGGLISGFRKIREVISDQVHTPQELGVPPWRGTEEEASSMIEKAAVHLGAAQVGFTAMDLTWLGPNVRISSDVEKPTTSREGIFFPPAYKYVIVVAGRVPMWAAKCAPGALGSAADRAGYEEAHMAEEKLMNFIRGIGYGAFDIHMMGINPIPFAVMAGLGEMGRMNRVVSPFFGGAVRFALILTDLPLALDKPIDFGLHEFCRHCRKCARACPVNAISFETDPSWEPLGPYSFKGKKVWFEDCEKCAAYTSSAGTYCSACLAACTWNKQNKTALHGLMRSLGAKLPAFSRFYALMDDLFGYGLIPEEKRKTWWKKDLPVKGVSESSKD
ncbi:MAG: reductive dehalogenase [Deltaproteobacteria bacterium]|nr:reductive dehalogenase [Deltaproteobacteria bacterium]